MVLCARGVSHTWKELRSTQKALQNVSLELQSGVPQFLVGPSGAGKTTLGFILAGLIVPTLGTVDLNGEELNFHRHRMAYLFQFPETIFFCDTVGQELDEVCGVANRTRVQEVFRSLGIALDEIESSHPFTLSEGFARLTALGMQMARDPDVFVLDEPTIGLDWRHQEKVIRALTDWLHPERLLITITHDLDLLQALGGQTWVISGSCLAWHGPTYALLADDRMLTEYCLKA